MNTTSTLEIRKEVQQDGKLIRLAAQLKMLAQSAVKSVKENSNQLSEASSRTAPSYRLGEAVQHGKFGSGRVMAHWPDGTLLVRFEGMAKSRLVWPSFLDRVDGWKS